MNSAQPTITDANPRSLGSRNNRTHTTDGNVDKPVFRSVRQTAELLGVSEKTVYRLLDRRLLKASPHLRRKLITVTSINAFADAANN